MTTSGRTYERDAINPLDPRARHGPAAALQQPAPGGPRPQPRGPPDGRGVRARAQRRVAPLSDSSRARPGFGTSLRARAPAPAPPAPSPAPAREAIPPLPRPFADEDDPLETGQIRVLGLWRAPDDPDPPDGRFFRFDAARVGAMIRRRFGPASDDGSGSDASSASSWITRGRPAGRAGTHVKYGDGAVLRCVNARTGKTSGVLLGRRRRGASGAGSGVEPQRGRRGRFRVGDVLDFPDLAAPPLDLAPVQRVTFNTGTGWNLAGPHLAFGRCGVVGDWWRTLEAEFRMDEETRVVGVYTDAPSELPVAVYHLAEGEEERWVEARTRETATRGRVVVVEPAVKTRGVRVAWETTDLHKTGGLSTARSGGGVHAHILATTADRDEGGVMAAAARGARAAPPAAPSTVRTAPAGAATAEPGTGWWSPRATVGEETRAPGQPQNNLPHV